MVIGDLKMTNYKEMTKKELIEYVKKHRTDDEAIRELFINRANPNATVYPADQTPEEIEAILRGHIEEKEQQSWDN